MPVSEEEATRLLGQLDDFLQKHSNDEKSKFDGAVFRGLYKQLLCDEPYIDWTSWKMISEDVQRNYDDLAAKPICEGVFKRVAVLRLNGGLGTTMGCSGPKSAIVVKDDLTFLDLAIKQVEKFNDNHGCSVPLLLMNSFYTHDATQELLKKIHGGTSVRSFCQSKCPRIDANTLLPLEGDDDSHWYPPGHGNIFQSLFFTGLLDQLLAEGRDIVFVSNIDNTGATLDLGIASFMVTENADYVMECTPKTHMDIKGGTLIDINGQLMHLESPQVPPGHLDEFCSTEVFKIFNTNNIWVNLRAVKAKVESIRSEIIVNKKVLNGQPIIQLETSIGGCIRNFAKAYCVHVPRSRFLPVKRCDDLLAIKSNLFRLEHDFSLKCYRPGPLPVVSLGECFQTVSDFNNRFEGIPDLSELMSLKIEGDVRFKRNVKLKGDVFFIAKDAPIVVNGSEDGKQ